MSKEVPKLDKRNYQEIVDQALVLARDYFPTGPIDWASIREPVNKDDPAYRLMEIFSRLLELLILRLNKVPVKNFLSFLELVGVEQKVGSPAEVPVTFLPAKSAPFGGDIPGGTQVATTQTDTADAQVFETRGAFYATPAKLKKVVNLIPGVDGYGSLPLIPQPPAPEDLEDDTRTITAFAGHDGSLSHIEHVLYIGSESLFGGEETIKLVLEISLSGGDNRIFNHTNLKWKTYNEENKAWENVEDLNVSYETGIDLKAIITIDPFTGTAKSEVNGIEDYWIACFFNGEFTDGLSIPQITGILGNVSPPSAVGAGALTAKIDAAFSNSTPIDPSKPVYPFGQRPQYGDAFYIGSKQAFAPDVASVFLKFDIHSYTENKIKEIYKNLNLARDLTSVTVHTVIAWEYLDESDEWLLLETFEHSFTCSKNLPEVNIVNTTTDEHKRGTLFDDSTATGIEITSDLFARIALKKLNKKESYWIRAVVKTFDSYGKDAWIEPTGDSAQPLVVIGPTFIPPIIEDVEILYTYKPDYIPVDSIQTKNNFHFKVPEAEEHFTPFTPITSQPVGDNHGFFAKESALYMGFDREFGDVYISMLMHIADAESAAGYALEQGNPLIAWEYAASDYAWKPLDVQDNTADLTAAGTAAFTGPSDSIKINLFKYLSPGDQNPDHEELYWYRARLANGRYDYPPRIKAIYLNTVMADNLVVSREDQVIGSGNGSANQKLPLVRVPVTGGHLWVREVEKPGEEELGNLLLDFRGYSEDGEDVEEDQLTLEIDKGGGDVENWVQWLKVPNFLSSGPRSRHYTMDAVNGQITFGNGENGMIPPAGKDNIIIKQYRTGGGEKANAAAYPLAVKELKSSLPYVDKVFNVQNAVGGSDSWSLDQTMEFGPQSLKHRGRAVTTEDYEWMVLQQFSSVARARCIATRIPKPGGKLAFKPGAATVIVVPKSSEPKPQPPKGLLKNIRDFLGKKALGNIFHDIHAIGPQFEEINITARVKPEVPGESSLVERRIIKKLEAFFHPLTGGETGQGWDFGRNVQISEVYAVIERTHGVEYVKNAFFTGQPGKEYIEIGDNSLGYSGTHEIIMETD
jgi:hypothetical protein